jgi:hypothetical protein
MAEYAEAFTPESARPLESVTRHTLAEAAVGVALTVGALAQPVTSKTGNKPARTLLENITVT